MLRSDRHKVSSATAKVIHIGPAFLHPGQSENPLDRIYSGRNIKLQRPDRSMTAMHKIPLSLGAVDSAARLFLVISFSIFIGELLIMLILAKLPPLSEHGAALLDATLLLMLTFPVLYFAAFRPLRNLRLREQGERELRESERQLREIFDGALDGIVVADSDSRKILAANSAICSMLGYAHAQILDLSVPDIHPEQGMPRVVEHFNRMLRGDLQVAIDMPVMRKDGSVFSADIKAASIRFGGKGAVLGTFRDVTERKRSEQLLIEAEAQFRGLVEQSIAGIYIVQDGKFAYVNPHYAEIFGYGAADELIGRDVLSIVTEKDRDTMAENIRRRMDGEIEAIKYDFVGLRKDGSVIDVGAHGVRATHRGRPAVIGMVQDISEKKRAEDEVKRYVAQIETAFMSTVKVATTLGEMRDPYTAGHQRRVAEIAVAIGAELGFDVRRQEGLRVAGYLHDIGKISIPAEILSKPGKLSSIEFQLIQAHPQLGYDVLKDLEFPWPVASVALQHHERVDGSGYPRGLKGKGIILEARIIAVADVMEAMSSHRPYRPGLGIDRALAEIERRRGSAYDSDVADACLKLFREKGYTIPE